MKTATTASELNGLELCELTIRKPESYRHEDETVPFIGHAKFWSSEVSGFSEIALRLDGDLSKNIVRALAPIIAQSAANAANKLAEDAKGLANSLSATMLKQLEPQPQVSPVS